MREGFGVAVLEEFGTLKVGRPSGDLALQAETQSGSLGHLTIGADQASPVVTCTILGTDWYRSYIYTSTGAY
jgi:hypothetical protein